MADRGSVVSAPTRTRVRGRVDRSVSLVVRVRGVDQPAVTVRGSGYQPAPGDDVTTIPLSNDTVLLLGLFS